MVPTQDVVLALHSSADLFPGAVVAIVVAALAVSLALVAVPRKDAD